MEKELEKRKPFINPERMQDMTDGIFAFAMTFLIVRIDFPVVDGNVSESFVSQSLVQMIPTLLNFSLAFFIIGLFWFVHHKQFNYFRKTNETLFYINLLTLLFIVFLPFTTDVMDDFGRFSVAATTFNINMLLIGVMFYWQWVYAAKKGLIDERISQEHLEYGRIKNSIFVYAALVALITGFFWPNYCEYAYLAIPIIFLLLKKYSKIADPNL